MKDRDHDDETSDSDDPPPIVFTKRIDASESILKLAILVLISVLSFRCGSSFFSVNDSSKHFYSDSSITTSHYD